MTPQASLRLKESISKKDARSIILSSNLSPFATIFPMSSASYSSMMNLKLWLVLIGVAILIGYFYLCKLMYSATKEKDYESAS